MYNKVQYWLFECKRSIIHIFVFKNVMVLIYSVGIYPGITILNRLANSILIKGIGFYSII